MADLLLDMVPHELAGIGSPEERATSIWITAGPSHMGDARVGGRVSGTQGAAEEPRHARSVSQGLHCARSIFI